jgi:hypothetical protein
MKSLQFVSCIYIDILGTWDSSLLFLSQYSQEMKCLGQYFSVSLVALRAVVYALSTSSFFFRLFFSVQNSGLEIGTTPTTILDK